MQLKSVTVVRRARLLSSYRITSKRSWLRKRIKHLSLACSVRVMDDFGERAYDHKSASPRLASRSQFASQ